MSDLGLRLVNERRQGERRKHNRRKSQPFVTVTDLARYWSVSVDTVYRDITKGALRAYRVGSAGTIRVHTEDARCYGRPNV
jgi:excisionase family DNA binding protein